MPSDQDYLDALNADTGKTNTEAQSTESQNSESGAQPPLSQVEIHGKHGVYKLDNTAEIPFKIKGQMSRVPLSQLLNAYNQHLVIQPKYQALMKEAGSWNTQRQEYDQLKSKAERLAELEKLQEWSEKNPDIFEHVWSNFQNKDKLELQHKLGATSQPEAAGQSPMVDPKIIDIISELRNELKEVKEWKSSREKQEEELAIDADVNQIKEEINQFKKSYPYIDLDESDENGVSVRDKIIHHGISKGYPTFKIAALDYLEPTLISKAVEQGRSEAVKGLVKDNQQGIIARSNKPFDLNGQVQKADTSKSYDQLANDAKSAYAELSGKAS